MLTNLRAHWQLICITIAVFALWHTPVVYPLKVLVVFLHELSHALAALLTGGSIEQISLSAQQGGFAVTRGGSRFAILTAGYLGSLALGVVIFQAALRTSIDRALMAFFGFLMLGVTLLVIRDLFAIFFTCAAGAVMLATARYLDHRVNDLALRVIGLTSMIYAPYDIFSDTLARPDVHSDAYMLAEAFGGTTVMWGGLWLLISLVVIGLCLRFGLGESSNIDLQWRGNANKKAAPDRRPRSSR